MSDLRTRAIAFRDRLAAWLTAQEIGDPMGSRLEDADTRFARWRHMRKTHDEMFDRHISEYFATFQSEYRQDFAEDAQTLFDAFGSHGLVPRETKFLYEVGTNPTVVGRVLRDVNRLIAELKAE
jgi:hypothetical protein